MSRYGCFRDEVTINNRRAVFSVPQPNWIHFATNLAIAIFLDFLNALCVLINVSIVSSILKTNHTVYSSWRNLLLKIFTVLIELVKYHHLLTISSANKCLIWPYHLTDNKINIKINGVILTTTIISTKLPYIVLLPYTHPNINKLNNKSKQLTITNKENIQIQTNLTTQFT